MLLLLRVILLYYVVVLHLVRQAVQLTRFCEVAVVIVHARVSLAGDTTIPIATTIIITPIRTHQLANQIFLLLFFASERLAVAGRLVMFRAAREVIELPLEEACLLNRSSLHLMEVFGELFGVFLKLRDFVLGLRDAFAWIHDFLHDIIKYFSRFKKDIRVQLLLAVPLDLAELLNNPFVKRLLLHFNFDAEAHLELTRLQLFDHPPLLVDFKDLILDVVVLRILIR